MKLKIKNIPTSFLFGLFFLFILSFSVSSTWGDYGDFYSDNRAPDPAPQTYDTSYTGTLATPREVCLWGKCNSISTGLIKCSGATPVVINGSCQACPARAHIYKGGGVCACPPGQEVISGQCVASCTGGKVRVGTTNSCQCPSSSPEFIGGQCRANCTGGKERVGNSCACPQSKPVVISGSCQACPSHKPYYHGNGYCSSVARSCDVTDKGSRPSGGGWFADKRKHWNKINSCLPGASGTQCYKKVDLDRSPGFNRYANAGKCLLPSTSSQEKCNAMCGAGNACTTTHKTGSLTIGGYSGNSTFNGLPYEKVTCATCPSGQEVIGGTCTASCTGGKVRSSGNSCVCRTGQEDVSGQCVASCTGGQIRSGSGQCVLSCTDRQIPNADRTACLSCPSTQVAKNGNCECPSGQVYRGKRCQAPETAPARSAADSEKEQICQAICKSSSCTIESHATTKSTRTGQGSGVSDLRYRKVICP